MRRFLFAVGFCALATAAMLFTSAQVSAITYGFVDSANTYSNVGAFIVQSPSGEIFPLCSGTLIAPNIFLTASHCTSYFNNVLAPEGYTAFVSFDKSIPFGDLTDLKKTRLIPVSAAVTNPNYSQSQSDSGDIAVLILSQDAQKVYKGIALATLPTCGLLDQLVAQNGLKEAVFTAAGYGLQNRVVGGGVPYFQDMNPIPRMYSFSSFNSLNGGYLRLSQNPATGNGGTCFGDSGGPIFLSVDSQQVLVAITITGDSVCRSTNVVYRLDTASARGFFNYVMTTYGVTIPLPSC
jgi:secreted trypsin-like serine protease